VIILEGDRPKLIFDELLILFTHFIDYLY